jgi:hypothetical protein
MKNRLFLKSAQAIAIALLAVQVGRADDLQPLGDEFGDAATFTRYQEHGALEGWGANHVESANINTSTPGHFRIVPSTTGWYEHLRGTHFSKNVTGNFIATAHIFVYSRRNPNGPTFPSIRLYSLGGILIREPRAITQAAPSPYTTNAVWPPQNFGSHWTPGDENWANTSELVGKGENYIFLSLGTAGNSGTRQFEIKTTRRSRSELYFSSNGISGSNEAWLQVIRVGNTVVCLRRHSAAGPWIVENRYPNADHAFPQFGPTLQVGLTAYTDFNSIVGYEAGGPQTQFHANYINIPGQPDLILDVNYLRLQRPHASLTEAMLQGMSVSYNPVTNLTANPPVNLTASPAAAPFLGDNANTPLGSVALNSSAISVNETTGTATLTVTRSGASTNLPLSLPYVIGNGTAVAGADFTGTGGSLSWAANDVASKVITIPLAANDNLAEGDENFTVTLGPLAGPATFVASAPTISATVTLQDAPLDAWRLSEFGAQANSGNGQPSADFDLDGQANLVEFAFKTPPKVPGGSPFSVTEITSDAVFLTYPVNTSATNVTIVAESSTDLASPSWSSVGVTYEAISVPFNGVQTTRARIPVQPGDAKRFVRLKVSHP